MHWFWICLAIGLCVMEIVSRRSVFSWIAISSINVAVLKLFFDDFGVVWQALSFVTLSAAFLVALRPLSKIVFQKIKAKALSSKRK